MGDEHPLGRVMLIDDQQLDQMIYTRILKRSRMASDILCFTYAEDALGYLVDPQNPPVDLILLDVNMPRMNGFEFLDAASAELGAAFKALVVIMLTTSLNPRDKARAASFQAVRAYINKPLELEGLKLAQRILETSKDPDARQDHSTEK